MYEPPQPFSEPRGARPLTAVERLALVDVLRGVAIIGVLIAYTLWNLGGPSSGTWSAADTVIDTLGTYLVDTKFISIFAFLFGVGTSQQLRRFETDDHGTTIVVRRMMFLLAAGVVHALLIRNGDILAPYAILGLALLGTRRWSNWQLAVAIVVLALLPYVVRGVLQVSGWKPASRPGPGSEAAGWTHYWIGNAEWVRYWYSTNPLLEWPRILAVMLAGVVADRARLMSRIATDRRLALRVLWVALALALIMNVGSKAVAFSMRQTPNGFVKFITLNQLHYLAAWSLAAVYVALFALICQRPCLPEKLGWLRAVGRMAFTNYLLQGVLVVPVCLAFGLFDTITPTRGLLFAIAVMAVQIPFSVWWLKRHEYGPVEWLWRRASYGAAFAEKRGGPHLSA